MVSRITLLASWSMVSLALCARASYRDCLSLIYLAREASRKQKIEGWFPCPSERIERYLGMESHTLSRRIAHLEKLGLIRAKRNEAVPVRLATASIGMPSALRVKRREVECLWACCASRLIKRVIGPRGGCGSLADE